MAVKEQAIPKAQVKVGVAESRGGFSWGKAIRYLGVVLVVLIAIGPLYWTFATSVKKWRGTQRLPAHAHSSYILVGELYQRPECEYLHS